MSTRKRRNPGSEELKTNICDVESRIRRRRSDISSALARLASRFREQTTSPKTLIAAGLFGAVLQRNTQLRSLIMMAILPLANAGLRQLFATASGYREQSPQEKRDYDAAENVFTSEGAPVKSPTAGSWAPGSSTLH